MSKASWWLTGRDGGQSELYRNIVSRLERLFRGIIGIRALYPDFELSNSCNDRTTTEGIANPDLTRARARDL